MTVSFGSAKPGEQAYTYDVSELGWDYSWVTDIDQIEEQASDSGKPITVRRQLWQLISEDEVTINPPGLDEEDDDASPE